MYSIAVATTADEIESCYPVMSQLRPHIPFENFARLIQSQMDNGYQLAYISDGQDALAVAGFRVLTNLAWGKFLYVDDLVTSEKSRSKGIGKLLLQWLRKEAKHRGCQELHLDSGIQRKDAHRFYEREGMEMTSYHFMNKL